MLHKHILIISILLSILLGKIPAIAQPNSESTTQNTEQQLEEKSCFVKDPHRAGYVTSAQDDPILFKDILWTTQQENQWLSSTGILINIYPEQDSQYVASTLFWESQNAPEAYVILDFLKQFSSSQEVNVTEFFKRHSTDGWRVRQPPLPCDVCERLGYEIHYLYSPTSDWMIDHLMAHAQGYVDSRSHPYTDIYRIVFGAYNPILEGRFLVNNEVFWFSARHAKQEDPWWIFFEGGEGEEPKASQSQERLNTFQDINNFIKHCLT